MTLSNEIITNVVEPPKHMKRKGNLKRAIKILQSHANINLMVPFSNRRIDTENL